MRVISAVLTAVLAVLLTACGGSGSVISSGADSTAVNVQAVSVGAGPSSNRNLNLLFTSVTLCVPGSATACATIDHILVDTGSSGLRVMASQLPVYVALSPLTDHSGNIAVVECAQFASGFTWGPVKLADVKLSGEVAASLPIQVIGDANFTTIPDNCTGTGPALNSVASLGANGVLGIGQFLQDCGDLCATDAANGFYYLCPRSGGCSPTSSSDMLNLARQVANPVALFTNDNNGISITLPPIPSEGAATVSGSLIFGIDTETNNVLGNAQVFTTTAVQGTLTTIYKNASISNSLFDSGSSVLLFTDFSMPACPKSDVYAPGFYCPGTTQTLSALIRGTNGASAVLPFDVANAQALVANHPDYWAFNNMAAPNAAGASNGFVWGLPAFYGRTVYTAIEGRTTSGGMGPFIAF